MDLAAPAPARSRTVGRWPVTRALIAVLLAGSACRVASRPGVEPAGMWSGRRLGAPPCSASWDGLHRHRTRPRVVLIRGINIGGGKVPPFIAMDDPTFLDRVAELGFGAIRLPFIWEAFEPEPGRYDEAYLSADDTHRRVGAGIARALCDRRHPPGRLLSPTWPEAAATASPCGPSRPSRATPYPARSTAAAARPGPSRKLTDPNMHRSFADFYADRNGVRT